MPLNIVKIKIKKGSPKKKSSPNNIKNNKLTNKNERPIRLKIITKQKQRLTPIKTMNLLNKRNLENDLNTVKKYFIKLIIQK